MPADPFLHTAFRGYDAEQVEALLARCARSLGSRAQEFAALAGPSRQPVRDPRLVTGEDVRQAQFTVRFRGYGMREVDDLLDRIADRLDRR